MTDSVNEKQNDAAREYVCSNCDNKVEQDFDFCPRCGSILKDGIFCDKHPLVEADGVRVVCGVPCCDECGCVLNELFLCDRHSDCEIFRGMVKICGANDEHEAEIAKLRLEKAGLHPGLFQLRLWTKKRGDVLVDYEPSI